MSDFSDRVKGMLYGLALGDAMGISTEFSRTTPKMTYDGYIPTIPFEVRFNQFFSHKISPGSVSDDTEMSLALLRALLSNDMKFHRDTVLKNYMEWANSGAMLGKNTRKLFKGVKTIKGYEKRFNDINEEEKSSMQSNGSLMRCSPLALIVNYNDCMKDIEEDVYLTNPNKVNSNIGSIYVSFLRILLTGEGLEPINAFIDQYTFEDKLDTIKEIKELFLDLSSDKRDVTDKKVKGWVCSAFYIAIKALQRFDVFQDAMDFVIGEHPGSDTDTNGAIAGALLGAKLGYKVISQENRTKVNIERLNSYFSTSTRDRKYSLLDIDEIVKVVDEKWKPRKKKIKIIIEGDDEDDK